MKFFFRSAVVLSLLLILGAFLVLLRLELSSPFPAFNRVRIPGFEIDPRRFQINPRIDRLTYHRRDGSEELQHLPTLDGFPFYLSGERSFDIEPEIRGQVRVYVHVDFRTAIQWMPLRFSLEQISAGGDEVLFTAEHGRMSRSVFRDARLAPGDRLRLRFRGHGRVYFSRPILYRSPPAAERTHVILIGLDTMRGDFVDHRVNGRSLTPNIAAFGRDGVVFTRAYAQSPWTIPSFTSLFTASYEFRHNVDIKHGLEPGFPHLVGQLATDFITFALHGGFGLNRRWGYSRGFDAYRCVPEAGLISPFGGRALFREAVRLLTTARFPRLFLFLHTYQVHSPYRPPLPYLKKLNPDPPLTRCKAISHGDNSEKFLPVSEAKRRSLLELYQAEILAFDAYFGEFIGELKRMGIYDNALIVFMSDHGEEFFEHGAWAHSQSLYDESIRVPLIFKFPRSRYRGEIHDPVGVIDILPTILGYLGGADAPEGVDGIDLMPLIRQERSGAPRHHLFSSVSTSRYVKDIPPKIAVVFDRYKMIYNEPYSTDNLDFFRHRALPPPTGRIELYDLIDDARETRNIAEREKDTVRRLMPLVLDVRRQVKAVLKARETSAPLPEGVRNLLETLGYL